MRDLTCIHDAACNHAWPLLYIYRSHQSRQPHYTLAAETSIRPIRCSFFKHFWECRKVAWTMFLYTYNQVCFSKLSHTRCRHLSFVFTPDGATIPSNNQCLLTVFFLISYRRVIQWSMCSQNNSRALQTVYIGETYDLLMSPRLHFGGETKLWYITLIKKGVYTY